MATGKPYVFGYYNDANKPFQKALTDHGFDTKGQDGIFGKDTRDAVEAAQEHFSISPADGVPRADLLSFLGIVPPPKPASNPITDYLTQLALKAVLANILKELPMDILKGYRTYLVSFASILVGIVDWTGVPLPGTAGWPPAAYILVGLIGFFGRAATNPVIKYLEDIIGKLGGVDPDNLPK